MASLMKIARMEGCARSGQFFGGLLAPENIGGATPISETSLLLSLPAKCKVRGQML